MNARSDCDICSLRVFSHDAPECTTSMTTAAPGLDLLKADAGVCNLNGSEAEVVIFAGILTPTDKANLVRCPNVTRAYGIAVTCLPGEAVEPAAFQLPVRADEQAAAALRGQRIRNSKRTYDEVPWLIRAE